MFLSSLQSVLRGREVGLFSHDVVFIGHIFERGCLFVFICIFDLDLEGHPTNGFERGWCFCIAYRMFFEVVKSACFHMTSFLWSIFLKMCI